MNESDSDIDTSTDVRVEPSDGEDTRVLTEERPDGPEAETSSNGSAPATSEETPDEKKKGWLVPLGVGLAVVLIIALVAIFLLMSPSGKKGRRQGGIGVGPQARWEFTSFAVGGKKADVPGGQQKAIKKLIRRWSDSVYLYPADLKSATNRYFTTAAANAFRASDVGLPRNARDVQTTKRAAQLWIDADGDRRAAAHVEVVATGKSSAGEFRSAYESQLWLERDGAAWKVIAYEVDQQPVSPNPGKGAKGSGGTKGKDGAKDKKQPSKKGSPQGSGAKDKPGKGTSGGKS